MKKLTAEEFQERIEALARARKIFGPLTENNITRAFEAYQEILAEQERDIFLSTQTEGRRPRTMMDLYERPRCPDCGSNMLFRVLPENPEGIKTQLVCESRKCKTILNSENDIRWWMTILRRKTDGSEIAPGGAEEKQ